jgi:TonB-dependent SusC/RagA subfamily outer membrane receptor
MKKLIPLLIMFFSLAATQTVFAQMKNISGTVTSVSDGAPIPGVNVLIKGTTKGTETDFDGNYSIELEKGAILSFSFIGMKTVTQTVGDSNTLNVSMNDDAATLDEVVITALGIKKSRKSLTYAAQDIKADELSRVKQTNPMNSLSGKVSGLNVTRSASGVGGSVKVTLRGNNSLGNNQPLYVVDGIPLSNPTSGQPDKTFGEINGGNRDGGDALSLINPDDIESMTVLKGASASALYGSAGLNGVILVTTKKGKSGSFKVNFSSNLTVDSAAYMLDLNDETQENVDSFLDTGITKINSISLSGGTEKAQTYFSYSNSTASGVLPTNKLKQHTFNVRETAKFFDGKVTADANVFTSIQKIDNRAVSGLYFNPLVGVYGFQSDTEKLSDYSNFQELDIDRNIQTQRWFRGTSDIEQNPYWITNRNASSDTNKKIVASLNLGFKINDWLSLQTRGTYDNSLINFERKIYATTEATLAPSNGRYITSQQDLTQLYADVIANINYNVNDDLNITANVGAITKRVSSEIFDADSGTNGGLQFANVFSYQNFNANPQVSFKQNSTIKQVNSIFASATVGYKDKLYLDLTARNDYSSALPAGSNSYFYPSVGATGILSELMNLGDKVSYAKLRASYAEVGNDVAANTVSPNREILFGGGVSPINPVLPLGTIRPEQQKSFEVGTEWKFNDNKFGFEFGYYHTSTIDQYFQVNVSQGTGTSTVGVNSGDVVNSGFEVSAFIVPFQSNDFSWRSTVNFAANKNEVKKLSNPDDGIEINSYTVSPRGVNTFASYLVEGGSYGDIYAKVVKRNEDGLPVVDTSAGVTILVNDDNNENVINELEKVGNANPDFTIGWSNSLQYKNWSFDMLIDGRFGGETVSMTEAIVEGFSNNSSRESANGTVKIVSPTGTESTLTAQEYYGAAGGRNGFTGEYVYSATNIRLAEFAVGYTFQLSEDSFFKRAKASFVGSNLFFFYKDAPHDPNVSLSTGNALQGVDVLGLPSSRSIGLNLNLTF